MAGPVVLVLVSIDVPFAEPAMQRDGFLQMASTT
jgi:hypothetical protein